jgi:hypothetical protein
MFASGMFRRASGLVASLLVAGLFFAGQGGAAQTTTNPNAQAIAQLKQTRALLHKADHDYKGNRVKAMHEITKAIHALEGTHGRHYHHAKSGKSGGEPQSVSDAQLKLAITQLQAVQSQLGSSTSANVGVANAAISRAIQDLQTALSIK